MTTGRLILALCLGLAGCRGGGGDDQGQSNAFCYTIAPAGGDAACSGCYQVSEVGNAFDANLSSFASVGQGGQGVINGFASQPGGGEVGVYFVLPGNLDSISVAITTYMDNTVQETGGPSTRSSGGGYTNCTTSMDCFGNGIEGGFIGLKTTKPYNKIEATVSNGSASGVVQIHELCSR